MIAWVPPSSSDLIELLSSTFPNVAVPLRSINGAFSVRWQRSHRVWNSTPKRRRGGSTRAQIISTRPSFSAFPGSRYRAGRAVIFRVLVHPLGGLTRPWTWQRALAARRRRPGVEDWEGQMVGPSERTCPEPEPHDSQVSVAHNDV